MANITICIHAWLSNFKVLQKLPFLANSLLVRNFLTLFSTFYLECASNSKGVFCGDIVSNQDLTACTRFNETCDGDCGTAIDEVWILGLQLSNPMLSSAWWVIIIKVVYPPASCAGWSDFMITPPPQIMPSFPLKPVQLPHNACILCSDYPHPQK